MRRRIFSFIVMVAIFIGACGGTVFATGEIDGQLELQGVGVDGDISDFELYTAHLIFKDVQTTDWFYDYVCYAYGYGLFTGTSANTFSPGATMTRAMFATVIYRLYASMGLINEIGDPYFTDVKSTDYYYNAVTWCFRTGIITGVGDAKFNPNNPVTRQEAATMLGRLIRTGDIEIPHVTYPDSASIADWASEFVDKMAYYELMTGNADGTFGPQQSLTRAQATKVLSILHSEFEPVQ